MCFPLFPRFGQCGVPPGCRLHFGVYLFLFCGTSFFAFPSIRAFSGLLFVAPGANDFPCVCFRPCADCRVLCTCYLLYTLFRFHRSLGLVVSFAFVCVGTASLVSLITLPWRIIRPSWSFLAAPSFDVCGGTVLILYNMDVL